MLLGSKGGQRSLRFQLPLQLVVSPAISAKPIPARPDARLNKRGVSLMDCPREMAEADLLLQCRTF